MTCGFWTMTAGACSEMVRSANSANRSTINRSPPDYVGELHLDRKEAIMPETHNDVIRDKHVPRVGDTVRSKKYGTLWRVIEKKEVWLNTSDDPGTGDCRAIPAIYLCYWRVQEGKQPGFGKMLGYAYSLHDNTFDANWEMVNWGGV
jgi:hypothetical protein